MEWTTRKLDFVLIDPAQGRGPTRRSVCTPIPHFYFSMTVTLLVNCTYPTIRIKTLPLVIFVQVKYLSLKFVYKLCVITYMTIDEFVAHSVLKRLKL